MLLETKSKKINLILRTRKIVDISNKLKAKNFEEVYFKAMNENDLDALSKIIYILAENIEGNSAFKSSEEVYDFMDEYKTENNKSYKDIFEEIATYINNEGFFTKKMNKKELQEKISNPLSMVDMNSIIQKSAEKAIANMAESELSGLKN